VWVGVWVCVGVCGGLCYYPYSYLVFLVLFCYPYMLLHFFFIYSCDI